jgi:hypothetical protein
VFATSINLVTHDDKKTVKTAGKRLFLFLRASCAASIVGVVAYGIQSICRRKLTWLPIWVIYVACAFSFPFLALHYTFTLLFQMNLSEVLKASKNRSNSYMSADTRI